MKKDLSYRSYFLTVFLTGSAVLIIEVAAVRVLSPMYGSSLYVLSSVLTIILAALSLGYWYGGRRADKEQSPMVLYSIIATSGLFVFVLLLLDKLLLPKLQSLLSPQIGPLLFSFGLFFIPTFLLGIVSPYIIKLQSLSTPNEHLGSVVGATFFWGTAGSIFGSLVTGFVLIPQLGVTHTIMFVAILLVALGILTPIVTGYPLPTTRTVTFLVISVIFCAALVLIETEQYKNYTYADDGLYSDIKVEDRIFNNKPARYLLRDANQSSAIYLDSKELALPYARFVPLYTKLIGDAENALILGGGAYTVPRTLSYHDPDLHIDVIEIEPGLFELSKKYFDLDNTANITNYVMDARVFLQTHDQKYDFILGDVFGTDLEAPFHLATYEFYNLIADHLEPNGLFFLNVTGVPQASQPSFIGSITKTLKSVFPNSKAYNFDQDLTSHQNVVFVARKGEEMIDITAWNMMKISKTVAELPVTEEYLAGEIILTDDRAPVEYLMSKQM